MPNQQEFTRNETTLRGFAERMPYPRLSSLRLLPPEDLCLRLLNAVEKAAVASAGSMDDLRRTVEEFTIVLKQQGASPEAVLIALKALIIHQTLPSDGHRMGQVSGDPVRQHISTWSIEEFFREESSP